MAPILVSDLPTVRSLEFQEGLILYYSVVSYYYTADEGKPVWTVPLHATVAFTGNNSSEILRDNDANKESIMLEVYL